MLCDERGSSVLRREVFSAWLAALVDEGDDEDVVL
jgi:hypothetical protein